MEDVKRLHEFVKEHLGDDGRWFDPRGYSSVALALIDSIYSTGNHYNGVINAVDKYRRCRIEEGAQPDSDTASDLLSAAERWGGPEGLADATTRWRCWPRKDAPLKADAALQAARILALNDLETVHDVRVALSSPEKQAESPVKRAWIRIPGHRSGLTWNYFLMLSGVPGVKADRMIVRYVERILDRTVDARTAASLVSAVADERGLRRTKLDHAIWRFESGRQIYVDDDTQFA